VTGELTTCAFPWGELRTTTMQYDDHIFYSFTTHYPPLCGAKNANSKRQPSRDT